MGNPATALWLSRISRQHFSSIRETNVSPKILASAVVVTFFLMACSTKSGDAGDQPCNSGVCKLVVTVAAAGCADAANIMVKPDPLPVPKGSANKLEWTIQTDGYVWVPAPGGITGLPDPPFKNPHDTGSGKKYDIHDGNPETNPTDYKYAIHLKKDDPSGTLCAVKDPIVRNGS